MTKEKVIALLLALGKTESEVADSLIKTGIKGNPGGCTTCPIANYLIQKKVKGIAVGPSSLKFYPHVKAERWHRIMFDDANLDAVRRFISAFDRGNFRQLRLE